MQKLNLNKGEEDEGVEVSVSASARVKGLTGLAEWIKAYKVVIAICSVALGSGTGIVLVNNAQMNFREAQQQTHGRQAEEIRTLKEQVKILDARSSECEQWKTDLMDSLSETADKMKNPSDRAALRRVIREGRGKPKQQSGTTHADGAVFRPGPEWRRN